MSRSNATPPRSGEPGESRAAERGNFTPLAVAEEPSGGAPGTAEDPASESRFAPRNWRVATKLNAILLIPVLLAVVFGGLRVYDAYGTWQEAERAERTAELVRAAAGYAHALIHERDVTAPPLLSGEDEDPVIEEAREATDAARDEFWSRVGDAPETASLERRIDTVAQAEPELDALRQGAYGDALPGVETQEGYIRLQHPLMTFANELSLGGENIASYGRSVYSVSLAKSASSLQRSIGSQLLIAPGPGEENTARQLTAFASYAYLEDVARNEFLSAASQEDVDLLARATDTAEEAANRNAPGAPDLDEMVALISAGGDREELADQGVTARNWFRVATTEFDAYRHVEEELVAAVLDETGEISAGALRDMVLNSAVVVVAVLLAFLVAGLMARSMSRNMTRLRTAALDVAEQRLPELVDQLSRTRPGDVDTRVAPLPIDSRDEIGQVSRAFDQVHREAVRLAAEQALLRGNVNAIFTNLSSRNQGLIERQLSLITELENNEADPEQLESLFKLDHLATRMRRNGENLLVLAGEEPGARWTQPVPLVDVVRAAASEVEAYDRIEISGFPESEIHGAVVTDLVHLLAELLENATTFSSPHTKVRTTATRLPDGRIMVEIHDKGIGLTPEDFTDINAQLARPPAVDAAISQRMGLYVVGRLAQRHGIRVQLRPSGEQSGTTSLVMLPEGITHGGAARTAPEEEFTVSRIVPEDPQVTEEQRQAGLRTAAELGFDDSRYPSAGAPGELDPVGRSLARGGRRAALEAQHEHRSEAAEDGGGRGDVPGDAPGHEGAPGRPSAPRVGDAPAHAELMYPEPGFAPPAAGAPAHAEPGHPGPGYPEPGYAEPEYGGPGYSDPRYAAPGYAEPGYPEPAGGPDTTGAHPFPASGTARDADGAGGGNGADGLHAAADGFDTPRRPEPAFEIPEEYGAYRDAPGTSAPFGPGAAPGEAYGTDGAHGAHEEAPQAGSVPPEPPPGAFPPHTQSPHDGPAIGSQRVGFGGPDPVAAEYSSTTSAGLPRRERRWQQERPEEAPAQERQREEPPADRTSGEARWDRGPRREARSGGTTSSGLPRRVPRANLTEHEASEEPAPDGTQVSRAPEDVRGRLSSLHRGVRQGRGASRGRQNDEAGFGPGNPYDQER